MSTQNPQDVAPSFGEWVRTRRRALDLTQDQLARLAGCARVTIRKIEADELLPSKSLAEILADKLGVPAPERDQFVKYARSGKHPESIPAQPAAVAPWQDEKRRYNLPIQLTNFIGRDDELARLTKLVNDPTVRLVTLIGAGGMGKTRLALEMALAHVDGFAHGAYFVPLAPLRSATSIVPTIAESVGFSFSASGEPKQQLLDYFREKSLLLVMDNFEHLMESASIVTDILRAAPRVQCIVTSRERLNLQEEFVFPVQGMEFPDWETPADAEKYDAVRLFIQSARHVQWDFALKPGDLKYLARICRLVYGMPLGVELAAGWVEMLPLAEIAAQIAQSADILETKLKNVPERQRSIRAAFDYSWNRLEASEREAFQKLSVFRGGFTRAAAQAVADASLRVLTTLVNKSLLNQREQGRFEIHELLRQYAEEQLQTSEATKNVETSEVYARHSDFYLAWLRAMDDEMKSSKQEDALVEMESDIENGRAAWERALTQNRAEPWTPALDALARFYDRRSRFAEGEEMCRATVERLSTGAPSLSLASALHWQGSMTFTLGHPKQGRDLAEQCQSILDKLDVQDRAVIACRANAQLSLGAMLFNGGDRPAAKHLYESSRALFQSINDQLGIASALNQLSYLTWSLGQYDESKQQAQESLAINQSLGIRRGIAESLSRLASVASYLGQFDEAERLTTLSLEMYRALNDKRAIAQSLGDLATEIRNRGRFEESIALLEECLALCDQVGDRRATAQWTMVIAIGYRLQGDYGRAHEWSEKALALCKEADYQRGVALCLNHLGEDTYLRGEYEKAEALHRQSVALWRTINHPAGMSTAIAGLGMDCRALKKQAEARQLAHEGFQTAAPTRSFFALLALLRLTAVLLVDQGDDQGHPSAGSGQARGDERAVELYALTMRYPISSGKNVADMYGQIIDLAAARLPRDVRAAAEARGKARDLNATAAELLAEMHEGKLFKAIMR